MPAKRRLAKFRSLAVSEAARARWRAVGGIEVATDGGGLILDDELAELLGLFPLIAYSNLLPILQQLRGIEDEA